MCWEKITILTCSVSILLLNFWRMNRDAVERGRTEAPYAFVIPSSQLDMQSGARLAEILSSGGVELHRARGALSFGGRTVGAGAWVVRCDQPFRPFILEMLANTEYPKLEQNGRTVRPYDVTAWRLSELLGVQTFAVRTPDVVNTFELEPADSWPQSRQRIKADRAMFRGADLASHEIGRAHV